MGPRQLGVPLLEQLHFNSAIVEENQCSHTKKVSSDHIILFQDKHDGSEHPDE